MKGYIYQIKNTKTGKRYIGSTLSPEKRKERHFQDLSLNKHHCVYLQRSYNIHGRNLFVFEIINEQQINTEAEIRIIEQEYLNNSSKLYNIGKYSTVGDNITNHPNKDTISQQISKTLKEKYASMTRDERRAKKGRSGKNNGMYGKTHSLKVKEQSRQNMVLLHEQGKLPNRKGKTNKELFGQEKAEEISRKLSNYGKTRKGVKNPFYGKHHTYETKIKLREKRVEKLINMTNNERAQHPQIKIIEIDKKVYYGVALAARMLGCSPGNITYKLKSNKYPNYNYLNNKEVAV